MGSRDRQPHVVPPAVTPTGGSRRARPSLDRTFAVLAEPNRRAVVELLRERPRRAGELAEALGLSPPALSRHLKTLRESGLVEESLPEFDARVRIYALKDGAMDELRRWLDETERLWAAQLTAFKAHVER
ncbi:MAG: ArsR/SmtB family transcription factor [Pseudomonadales bacterium]